MVIVQFRGSLVRQYRACVVDSLGLGITCLISLYCVQHIPILSLLIFMPSLYSTFQFKEFLHLLVSSHFKLTIPNVLIILVQVSSNATSSQKNTPL